MTPNNHPSEKHAKGKEQVEIPSSNSVPIEHADHSKYEVHKQDVSELENKRLAL
eukprot:CAMPEP_0202972344 /NCGR_PEP_ID=MMETSP1396-20130829/35631_1 /ASSEMBLY_ACC=CAM_ASM_000872 /TAXON_ID= /ORGANISM="Pseudokeronopsis sp., Strain Brazil" /LENGTH=53 /DNA_ID=CAMNT_0049702651 /DNA_START=671 /DNA_END=832 /DNA_ORIENTATION=-